MDNLAERQIPILQPETDNPALKARAEMLRALILSIPDNERAATFAQVRDTLPLELFAKSKAPQRGGDILNNVFELFQREPAIERGALEIARELAVEAQPVRNALNYLNSRRVLQRVGYGKYRMGDGSLVDGPV
jgi:hypothetical protein